MRFAVDTGGTFTDLIIEDDDGKLWIYKAPTTPDDPIRGVVDSIDLAAADWGISRAELLSRCALFFHGTTRAINAIVTHTTAKTAFLTTAGHPDVLVIREGGRTDVFNFQRPYPEPYVPRALTFEVEERINATGQILKPLAEPALGEIIGQLRESKVEAVGVCLLWSIINPVHELRVGELLMQKLPGVAVTLSHQLNPSLREYRRASSTCIDASLKPLMVRYMADLDARLQASGFVGRLLILTSQGGVIDAQHAANAPIHLINSGPSMAPIAGGYFAELDGGSRSAIVADTGGTTYDVSLVRDRRIPFTRETWVGEPYFGHMTGFPSVDVRSIGAGGGSIAWVDRGGMLHVGPQSAAAVPGPASYKLGGTAATVTDACIVLGYIDPDFFLGGAMKLDRDAAVAAVARVGRELGTGLQETADAIMRVTTENMVQAILDITVKQGIDPASAVLIGGGGAAGLNSYAIGRRLNTPRVIIPEAGAALSAAGALLSELTTQYRAAFHMMTRRFEKSGVRDVLQRLRRQCDTFLDGPGKDAVSQKVEFAAEARYLHQVWEIEVPLRRGVIETDDDVAALREDFHRHHEELFAFSDPGSEIEIIGWSARVSCRLRDEASGRIEHRDASTDVTTRRMAYFHRHGNVETDVRRFENIEVGKLFDGPAIVESSFTTVVLDPDSAAIRAPSGSLVIYPNGRGQAASGALP
jgi:N-methylhydantoinase A